MIESIVEKTERWRLSVAHSMIATGIEPGIPPAFSSLMIRGS